MSMDRAHRRIVECRKQRSPILDLSSLGLDQIPSAVFGLTHLIELDLGINYLNELPKERGLNKTTYLRQMGNGDIVPLWQKSIKANGHGLFEIFGNLALGCKNLVENRSKNG